MQAIREFQFSIYEDSDDNIFEPLEIPDFDQRCSEAFDKIEHILEEFGFASQITKVNRDMDECMMYVSLSCEVSLDRSIELFKRLEEHFRVVFLQFDTEEDSYYDEVPHVLYGFYLE